MAHGLAQLAVRPGAASMKVAVVCPYDIGVPGGVQAQVLGLTRFLRGSGEEAWVVAPGNLSDSRLPIRSVGSSLSIRANDSVAPLALDPRVSGRVRAAVADADVVHIHEPFIPVVSWAALRSNSAQVLTFHADPPRWAAAVYTAGRPALERIVRRAGAVTAVSPVAAAPLRRLGIEPVIVPNAVGLPEGVPDLIGRGPTVSFVGRDEPRKGLDVLLAAWPEVVGAVPDAHLSVISRDRGAAVPGVTYHPDVTDGQRDEMLADSAVFVAPNRRGESFGITVAEAMAQGCAIVASDLPAFRHVGGEALTYVPPGDPRALADAVSQLLIDEPRRVALGQTAASTAQRYGWQAVGEVYVEMYHNAVHS